MGLGRTLERLENVILPLIQCEGGDVGHEFGTNCLLGVLKVCSRLMLLGVRLRMGLYKIGILRRHPLGCRIIRVGEDIREKEVKLGMGGVTDAETRCQHIQQLTAVGSLGGFNIHNKHRAQAWKPVLPYCSFTPTCSCDGSSLSVCGAYA